MNSVTPHPDPETLLRLVDDDLAPTESQAIRDHLSGCGECRDRLQALRTTLDSYHRFHRDILKPALPPPPNPWTLELPAHRPTRIHPLRWLAPAAAVALTFFLVYRFQNAPEVRASELLRKAAAAEQSATRPPRARIRIRTRSRTLDRAARLTGPSATPEAPDAAALHAMFDAAGYSWDDPLSAAAFSRWRDGLPQKQDKVDQTAGLFLVQTLSPAGVLSDAALTLRAGDLHAVACTLRFRSNGETIDMTELPADTVPAPAAQAPAEPQPSPAPIPPTVVPPQPATAGDELRVMAALHRIDADLGEPVEVQREGANVVVRVTGLDEHRRDQLRAGLSSIAVAQLHFEDLGVRHPGTSLPPTRTAVPADRPSPLISELRARLASDISVSDLSDQLIDCTDRATERAFALRVLARHFAPDVAAGLSPSDAAILNSIVHDHADRIAAAIQEIRRLLTPILPGSTPPAPNTTNWQSLADSFPPAIERLDRTLNGATDASDARKSQLGDMIARLGQQVAALQSMVRQ